MRIIGFENDGVDNPILITPFFIVHLLSGIWLTSLFNTIFPKLKMNTVFWIVLFIHTLYEIKDLYVSYVMKYITPSTNNRWLNSIGDTIAVILGYMCYQKYPFNIWTITVIYILISLVGWFPYLSSPNTFSSL